MLAAVDLDGEPRLEAGEIDDIAADGRLPAEVMPAQLPAPKPPPEKTFSARRITSEPPRPLVRHGPKLAPHLGTLHPRAPHPNPPPRGGRGQQEALQPRLTPSPLVGEGRGGGANTITQPISIRRVKRSNR